MRRVALHHFRAGNDTGARDSRGVARGLHCPRDRRDIAAALSRRGNCQKAIELKARNSAGNDQERLDSSRLGLIDEAMMDGVEGQLQPIGNAELIEDIVQVILYGLFADE